MVLSLDRAPVESRPQYDYVLTQREWELLSLLGKGLDLSAAVAHMGIQQGTANRHLQNIYQKLGARSRAHAVYLAYARGIIDVR